MDKSVFSNKVYIYTFILSVLVVLVHSVNFSDSNTILLTMIQSSDFNNIDLNGLTGWAAHFENFMANAVGQAAVPGFFMISGYLYFRTLKTIKDAFIKWIGRFHTLVVPFVFWNFIYYLIYMLCGKAGLNIYSLYEAIVHYAYNHVFWYVYQLILLTLLAPMFYYIFRRKYLTILFAVGYVFMVIRGVDVPLINEDALLYYFSGAFLARYFRTFFEGIARGGSDKRDISYTFRFKDYISIKTCVGILMIFFVWGTQVFTTVGMQMFLIAPVDVASIDKWKYWYYGGPVSTIMVVILKSLPTSYLVGILSVGGQIIVNVIRRLFICFAMWLLLPERLPDAGNFMKNGFFLYAVHYPIARVGIYVLEYMSVGYHGATDQSIRLAMFLMTPVVCVALSYLIKVVMEKHAPIIWKVFSGGR